MSLAWAPGTGEAHGWVVKAKLVRMRFALCRRRRNEPEDAMSVFEINSNLDLQTAPGHGACLVTVLKSNVLFFCRHEFDGN